MAGSSETGKGPDLAQGVAASDIPDDGVLAGHVGDDPVLLARIGGEIVALGGTCSHYGAPLAEGLRVGDTINCPWHHACFDLHSGAALKAPALSPLDCWTVAQRDGRVTVRGKRAPLAAPRRDPARDPRSIVIVGGGAAGFAAAQRLRELGYAGTLTVLSADEDAPYDRPNCSKDYLAGEADPAWMPLKDDDFYTENRIDLRTGTEVERIDAAARQVVLAGGATLRYDRLLLATGAEPIRPAIAGFDRDNVRVLRSLADSDALIAAADRIKAVAMIGASFIGLEAAAAFRSRNLAVHIVAPEDLPLAATMGPQVGALVKRLHEQHGVRFHLGRKVQGFDGATLTLDDGATIEADLVVLGMGVEPRLGLAASAGLTLDRGVVVDAAMRTSDPHIFAAGDIACYPDPAGGAAMRIEHWVVAERQGQVAAAAMLGLDARLTDAPFFWSAHYDLSIRYVGHAESWDTIEEIGSVADQDAELRFIKDGRLAAVVTIRRDMAALKAAEALKS